MAGNKLSGMIRQKCPRCHKGDLFLEKNPYNLRQLGKMPEECKTCGQDFVMEPGFYFGATYVSYALAVAIFVAGVVINLATVSWDLEISGPVFVVVFLILTPIVFRLSRSIWIHFFVKYDPNAVT